MRSLSFLASLAAVAALCVPAARATTMVPSSLEKLVTTSESVIRGTTVATRTEWDAHRRIVTIATVRVLEGWHGPAAPGAEIEVTSFGGERDGIRMTVPGSPRFTPGEEVVLFLGRAPGGPLSVVDMAQGKFEVVPDETGAPGLLRRDLVGVEWVGEPAPAVPSIDALRDRVTILSRLYARTPSRGGAR
jgi:hypothetical protein